jgi:D-alanyl-D-alanine carboxypeptidase
MPKQPSRLLLHLLVAFVAACTATAPVTPEPTLAPTPTPSLAPTPSPSPSPSPTASPSPSPSPSPSATASPTQTPSLAPTPTGTAAPSFASQLQTTLDNLRAARRAPGISATVIFPDGSEWNGASGDAQLDPDEAAAPDTPFVVGSITKTFITALIMQMAEEGTLSIDDPLANWLPDYPRADRITLRHLLGHTSGVFNYFDHSSYTSRVFGNPRRHWEPQEVLDELGGVPYFPPGTGYHYSNTNFVLLGMVAEEATSASLAQELEERFFTPLGLEDTYFQYDEPAPPSAALGYLLTQNGAREISDGTDYRPTTSAATVAWAAGNIAASAIDIARWARALYAGTLLNSESLAEMTDFAASGYSNGAYGLGTRTRVRNGQRMIGHTGSLRGFQGAMWHYPEVGLTVVVLHNRGRADASPIADALAAVALAAIE